MGGPLLTVTERLVNSAMSSLFYMNHADAGHEIIDDQDSGIEEFYCPHFRVFE